MGVLWVSEIHLSGFDLFSPFSYGIRMGLEWMLLQSQVLYIMLIESVRDERSLSESTKISLLCRTFGTSMDD
jgi:hypothetical protein